MVFGTGWKRWKPVSRESRSPFPLTPALSQRERGKDGTPSEVTDAESLRVEGSGDGEPAGAGNRHGGAGDVSVRPAMGGLEPVGGAGEGADAAAGVDQPD